MEEQAYRELRLLERRHWWYRDTCSIYRMLLRRYVPDKVGQVLDLGCGTGGNLEMLAERGTVVRYASYLNFFLFPAAASMRLVQRLATRRSQPHQDMFPVAEPFNTVLAGVLATEGRMMRWASLPCGVSIVMVLGR